MKPKAKLILAVFLVILGIVLISGCVGSEEKPAQTRDKPSAGTEPTKTTEELVSQETNHACGTITPNGILAVDPQICMSKTTKSEQDNCNLYCQVEFYKSICVNPTSSTRVSGISIDDCLGEAPMMLGVYIIQTPSKKDKVIELCNMISDPTKKEECTIAVNELAKRANA